MSWTEENFKKVYSEYKTESRKKYLIRRTTNYISRYDFGHSVLLYGGALGWGGLPLLDKGIEVYNYDTSNYIRSISAGEKLPPTPDLPEGYFDTIFFEDSIYNLDYKEKSYRITTLCIIYKPKMVLVIESSAESKLSKHENKLLIKTLNDTAKPIKFYFEYYNK